LLHQIGAVYLGRLDAAERLSRSIGPESTSQRRADRITDKLPANFMLVGLIHLVFPNARIIHTTRDPIDTCISCFSTLFASNQPHTYELGELGRYYRGYVALMAHWQQVLPAGILLNVQYEQLVTNFEVEARRILEYCGLDWQDACLNFYKTERPIQTASMTQARQPIYRTSIGRIRTDAVELRRLLIALGNQ
jgi:hypothetical protein